MPISKDSSERHQIADSVSFTDRRGHWDNLQFQGRRGGIPTLLVTAFVIVSVGWIGCTQTPEGEVQVEDVDDGAGEGRVEDGPSEDVDGGRVLFNGESFDGWEGNLDMFRIEDEAIAAGSLDERIPQNEFLCTESEFDDFELRAEFRLLGGEAANAGIQFRSQRIPDHHEVIGYQADMGDGWWGALYDESRRNRILAAPDSTDISEVLNREDWNDYVIQAEGRRIRLAINGYETVDYTEPGEDIPQSGKICLQIHGGPPAEAWYRNISLRQQTD